MKEVNVKIAKENLLAQGWRCSMEFYGTMDDPVEPVTIKFALLQSPDNCQSKAFLGFEDGSGFILQTCE